VVGNHVLLPDHASGPDPHHYDTQYVDGARFLEGA
jgi:hypothetical protein